MPFLGDVIVNQVGISDVEEQQDILGSKKKCLSGSLSIYTL